MAAPHKPEIKLEDIPAARTVDVIIISAATNPALQKETEYCLQTLFQSETDVRFNVVVVESARSVSYAHPQVNTIHPGVTFGYHRYLNIGRKLGHAPYVCLCNNDLEFEPGWASSMIERMEADPELMSSSPYCRQSHAERDIQPYTKDLVGYDIRYRIAGWCIFQRRSIYDVIGDLDEQFVFWYADNDYGRTLEHHQLKHALITHSVVNHKTSQTLKTRPPSEKRLLTRRQKAIFDKKWNRK